MSILEKCEELQNRIDKLRDAQQSAAESKALSQRLSEARELRDRAKDTHEKALFLKENDIQIDTSIVDLTGVLMTLEKIVERFAEKSNSSSLSKGKDWAKLLDQGVKTQSGLETETLRAWKRFIDGLSPGQSPNELRATLAKTEKNTSALQKFTDLYGRLKQLRDEFPDDADDIANARALGQKLKGVSEAFDYDVPDDVKTFLAAIDQGGAPLELLTEEVVVWLRENQSEDHYRIVGNR